MNNNTTAEEDVRAACRLMIVVFAHAGREWRKAVLRAAVDGDWYYLGEYIRKGGLITASERQFLADVLTGKMRRPRKKISKLATQKRNSELMDFVLEARQRGKESVPRLAEERFGRTWRQLQKVLAAERENPNNATQIEMRRNIREIRHTLARIYRYRTGRDISEAPRGPRYLIDDMALTPHTVT
jgi:hypothetical protein